MAILPRSHLRPVIHVPTSVSGFTKPSLTAWAESFFFAGSSALLLLIAHLFSQYWYLCLFALIPFLYRIIKASPRESLRLGFLLGLSYFGASTGDLFITSPLDSVLKIFTGTVLFTLFGWSVGWARQRWGFNPSLVSLLWVGLETVLVKLGLAGGLIRGGELSNPFLHSLIGLFGFLVVSALIILLNSLLALALVKTVTANRSRDERESEVDKTWSYIFIGNLLAERVYLVPEGRAPPNEPTIEGHPVNA